MVIENVLEVLGFRSKINTFGAGSICLGHLITIHDQYLDVTIPFRRIKLFIWEMKDNNLCVRNSACVQSGVHKLNNDQKIPHQSPSTQKRWVGIRRQININSTLWKFLTIRILMQEDRHKRFFNRISPTISRYYETAPTASEKIFSDISHENVYLQYSERKLAFKPKKNPSNPMSAS